MLIIDYDLAIEMISYDIAENGIDKSNVTLEQIQEAEKECKDKEDLLNYLLVLFKGDDGYSKRLITRIGKLL